MLWTGAARGVAPALHKRFAVRHRFALRPHSARHAYLHRPAVLAGACAVHAKPSAPLTNSPSHLSHCATPTTHLPRHYSMSPRPPSAHDPAPFHPLSPFPAPSSWERGPAKAFCWAYPWQCQGWSWWRSPPSCSAEQAKSGKGLPKHNWAGRGRQAGRTGMAGHKWGHGYVCVERAMC